MINFRLIIYGPCGVKVNFVGRDLMLLHLIFPGLFSGCRTISVTFNSSGPGMIGESLY